MSDPRMPDDDWDPNLGSADDGAVHDPLLQQMLQRAPDHAATPNAALTHAIRVLAHEAVAPSLPPGPVGVDRPWWQRLLGIGGGAGSRMPWNAAFATVLVGVLVTVMWQREPVPGAQLDAPRKERQTAPSAPVPAPAPAPAPVPAPAPEPKAAEATPTPPPLPSVLDTTLAESRAVTEAANRALDERDREWERQARQAAADREATLAADKAVERAQQALAREEAAKMKAEPPLPPPVQWPPPMPPAPVVRSAPSAEAAPPGAALRAAPPAASTAPSRAAGIASPPPAPVAPAPSQAPEPSFNALAQWTQLRITRNGADSHVLPRAEARDLGALVGSAALAGVGSQPLAGTVDWRIALERDGEVLGVLELAGGQVRWREKGVPPGTGQPGAGALSSLRQALEEAR